MKAGDLLIDESEIVETFVRSSGPGGQNVNKVASAVELRFDARGSPSLPNDVAVRLIKLAGSRATQDGVIVIFAQSFASQPRNREDARARLTDLLLRRRRGQAAPRHAADTRLQSAPRRREDAPRRGQGAEGQDDRGGLIRRADPSRNRLSPRRPSVALPGQTRRPAQRAVQPRRTNRRRGRSSFPRLALHRGEICHVVRADELHFAERKAREFSQARLIGASLRAVELHQRLEPAHAFRRGAAVRLDFGVMKIGVAAMEQPIVRTLDRDAAMPARMAGQRHQQHLVARSGNGAHGRKAKPGFALFLDRSPFLDRGDLHLAIAVSLAKVDRCEAARSSPAKTWTAASGKSQIPPAWSRSRWVGTMWRTSLGRKPISATCLSAVSATSSRGRADCVEQESEPPRLVDILDPEPGIDQDQAVIALDQQAVAAHGRGRQRAAGAAEQLPAARTERPAIEVMDAHGLILRPTFCHRSVVSVHLRQPRDYTIED